jgi:hypothetical protein
MRIVIASAAIALILTFKISNEASRFGQAVAERFLERGNSIPPGNSPITVESLRSWTTNPENGAAVRGYIYNVLPWDIVFLACLGCFLALGSAALAPSARWASNLPSYIFWVVPGLYMLADLAEDIMIAWLLSAPGAIGPPGFGLMRSATQLKTLAAGVSFGQLLLVCVLGLFPK